MYQLSAPESQTARSQTRSPALPTLPTHTPPLTHPTGVGVANQVMQWETATPVDFPVCVRHNDCEAEEDCGVKIEG